MLLNPQISNQHEKVGKLEFKWTGIYRIEKVFTRSNYLIRKVNTNFTQIVHRVRLKPFKPQYKVEDIKLIDDKSFCEDPLIPEVLKESQLFDCQVEHIVYRPIDSRSTPSVRTTIKHNYQKRQKFLINHGRKHLQKHQKMYHKQPPQRYHHHKAHLQLSKLHQTNCLIKI